MRRHAMASVAAITVIVAVMAMLALSRCGSDADRVTGSASTATVGRSDTTVPAADALAVETLSIQVVDVIDHDTDAFTQGLVFASDGRLFESTGEYGDSEVRQIDPASGKVLRATSLPAEVFAEGLAVGPDGLVQLTWKEGRAFRWATDTFEPQPEWRYAGEGWGLTYSPADDTFLRSDGTATVTRHRRDDFSVLNTVTVTRDGDEVTQLNELELIDGELFANVWMTDEILRVDPGSGRVTGVVDASPLRERGVITDTVLGSQDVLNGIAHRPGDPPNRWYVTGKNWPAMFVVDIGER